MAARLCDMLPKRHSVFKMKHHVAQQLGGSAASRARTALEPKSGVLVKQGLDALGELHSAGLSQNRPGHIWTELFATHGAIGGALYVWTALCRRASNAPVAHA
jgi:hypothetical protein